MKNAGQIPAFFMGDASNVYRRTHSDLSISQRC